METLNNTQIIKFVLEAHGDQLYGDMPYITHLILVSRHFKEPIKQAIALLHDTIEDTTVTYHELYYNFGKEIAEAVMVLTRRKEESYFDYIRRVKKDPLATEIKIADLRENIFISKYNFTLIKPSLSRYQKALKILKGEIE